MNTTGTGRCGTDPGDMPGQSGLSAKGLCGSGAQASRMNRYYAFHSKIYDMTRWSFLFGRRSLPELAAKFIEPKSILEVGCGTGRNMLDFSRRFPAARVVGVDVSPDMIRIADAKMRSAGYRVDFINASYDAPISGRLGRKFDVVVFSYCLSMINPGWESAVECAREDITEKGVVLVTDFDSTRSRLFERWMAANHVQMRGVLPEKLGKTLMTRYFEEHSAYMGLWKYFRFAGGR